MSETGHWNKDDDLNSESKDNSAGRHNNTPSSLSSSSSSPVSLSENRTLPPPKQQEQQQNNNNDKKKKESESLLVDYLAYLEDKLQEQERQIQQGTLAFSTEPFVDVETTKNDTHTNDMTNEEE